MKNRSTNVIYGYWIGSVRVWQHLFEYNETEMQLNLLNQILCNLLFFHYGGLKMQIVAFLESGHFESSISQHSQCIKNTFNIFFWFFFLLLIASDLSKRIPNLTKPQTTKLEPTSHRIHQLPTWQCQQSNHRAITTPIFHHSLQFDTFWLK